MKYFTKELWKAINSEDPNKRSDAERQWHNNGVAYMEYISANKRVLPQKVDDLFAKYAGLHDATLSEISLLMDKEKSIKLVFNVNNANVVISLEEVQSVSMSLFSLTDIAGRKLSLGYHEFEFLESNRIRFSAIFDTENEVDIIFKSINMFEEISCTT